MPHQRAARGRHEATPRGAGCTCCDWTNPHSRASPRRYASAACGQSCQADADAPQLRAADTAAHGSRSDADVITSRNSADASARPSSSPDRAARSSAAGRSAARRTRLRRLRSSSAVANAASRCGRPGASAPDSPYRGDEKINAFVEVGRGAEAMGPFPQCVGQVRQSRGPSGGVRRRGCYGVAVGGDGQLQVRDVPRCVVSRRQRRCPVDQRGSAVCGSRAGHSPGCRVDGGIKEHRVAVPVVLIEQDSSVPSLESRGFRGLSKMQVRAVTDHFVASTQQDRPVPGFAARIDGLHGVQKCEPSVQVPYVPGGLEQLPKRDREVGHRHQLRPGAFCSGEGGFQKHDCPVSFPISPSSRQRSTPTVARWDVRTAHRGDRQSVTARAAR